MWFFLKFDFAIFFQVFENLIFLRFFFAIFFFWKIDFTILIFTNSFSRFFLEIFFYEIHFCEFHYIKNRFREFHFALFLGTWADQQWKRRHCQSTFRIPRTTWHSDRRKWSFAKYSSAIRKHENAKRISGIGKSR